MLKGSGREEFVACKLLGRAGKRHFGAEAEVLPDGGDLFFGVAIEDFGEWAFAFFEIDRHFGLGIDGEGIAEPTTIVLGEQPFA